MSAQTPLVTVYIASYNYARFLDQAIDSVLDQTLREFELIIIDDGSTDGSREIIEKYADHEKVITVYQRNQGLAVTNNIALRQARGQYVMRLDADDWVTSNALSGQVDVLDMDSDVDIVLPDYWRVEDSRQSRRSPRPDNVFTWQAAGFMMRKERVRTVGGYRPLFWEEYDLYLRMLENGAGAAPFPQPVLYYRAHADSMTARKGERLDGWTELLQMWPRDILDRWGHHEELEEAAQEQSRSHEG